MSQKEQRRSPRKPVTLNASVTHPDTHQTIAVHTLNLSKLGALVESPDKIYPDAVCTFKFVTQDARVTEIEGRIAWVEKDDAGMYRAGVAFRNLSSDEEYMLELQIVRSGKTRA